jgi:methyl-accepting chemotaxis protein
MQVIIRWIMSSIRNKLLLITGSGTTLLLASALFGLWQAWNASGSFSGPAAQVLRSGLLASLALMGLAILISFVVFVVALYRGIIHPAHQMVRDLSRLAEGDFSMPIQQLTHDEIGEVAQSAEKIRSDLGAVVRNVQDTTEKVLQAASALAGISRTIVQGSQSQSDAAASTSASVKHVTDSIGSVAVNAEDVRRLSMSSVEETKTGHAKLAGLEQEMNKAVAAMQEIAQSVNEFVSNTATISQMTQQVKDIADQTNLLALNAAIEAARAGEQGRGFAVVADEVRKLAEKSAQSASQIDGVTRAINEQSAKVSETLLRGQRFLESSQALTKVAADALERTRNAAIQANDGVVKITVLVKEQNAASAAIGKNVDHIADMAEENSREIEKTSTAAQHLEELARALEEVTVRFKV